MKSLRLLRHARAAIMTSSTLVVTGCAIAPGTYLGAVPPEASTSTSVAEVEARADLHSITPTTVAAMIAAKKPVATNAGDSVTLTPLSPNASYQYLIGAQDMLQVTVWNHPELSNPASTANELSGRVVDADGYFFFPYAGRIRAAGRTVADVRRELTRKLAAYLVEPQVDVAVSGYRSQRVFVVGQVTTPGPVAMTDVPLTITDLITRSGGLTPEADLRNVQLNRNGRVRPVDLYALYYQGDMRQNVALSSNDIITIPENRYNKVFVMGEVRTPQSLVMPRGRISLSEAISDAGGFDPLSANTGQVYVIRKGANERPQIWHLNASSPDALVLADSFDLEARDIVYVDPAAVARWSRVINNILPSAAFLDGVGN